MATCGDKMKVIYDFYTRLFSRNQIITTSHRQSAIYLMLQNSLLVFFRVCKELQHKREEKKKCLYTSHDRWAFDCLLNLSSLPIFHFFFAVFFLTHNTDSNDITLFDIYDFKKKFIWMPIYLARASVRCCCCMLCIVQTFLCKVYIASRRV